MKKENKFLSLLVMVFGLFGLVISLIFGYTVTVIVKKKETWEV